MIKFRLTIEGTAPLLMHNSRLADPLDPTAKALKKFTAKRKKTDEDHEMMNRLDFLGGLYLDPDIGPYVPGQNIATCLRKGAEITRRGKDVVRGVLITSDPNPLWYQGPRDAEALWADENFKLKASVKVGTSRLVRCRPMFREWKVGAEGLLDPAVIDLDVLEGVAVTAGQMVGLGDWRPRYGRFEASLEKL